MECIAFINDLKLEIDTLKDLKNNSNSMEIDKIIAEKESIINTCKENLSKLSNHNIEYRIYLYILQGLCPSKAIEKISNENYLSNTKPVDISTLWKYYKKMKNIIKPSENLVR